MKKFSLVLALAASLLFAQAAAAANLVVNGDFETGTFDGWGNGWDNGWSFVDTILAYPPNSGTYSATLGSADAITPGIISQKLATTIGQSYIVSFWLANGYDPKNPIINNQISVDWGGANLYAGANLNEFGWTYNTFTVTANNTETDLTFTYIQVPSFFHLDDVSVSAVPIPGSLVLLASALLPLGWRRLRKS